MPSIFRGLRLKSNRATSLLSKDYLTAIIVKLSLDESISLDVFAHSFRVLDQYSANYFVISESPHLREWGMMPYFFITQGHFFIILGHTIIR